MRKGLTVGAVFASVVLAGCSGGGATPGPPSDAPTEAPAPPSSSRTAPAKSLQVADACGVLTPEQQQALGANQPPEARESNGMPGCSFVSGDSGTQSGWNAFVAVNTKQTLQQFVQSKPGTQPITVAGYPAAKAEVSGRNCSVVVDVSDQGSVMAYGLSRDQGVNGCDVMQKVAEAVVQNLPNA
ncbi:uncharacterized protein DUF3558 [Saccharopolyspora dendranthemae]|uniref:Uncharacterized protein DUF3558 n=1 Tax=Saccharopolyspora dendranthemae TaxID=1181886 RepID=A0A561V9N2_9PSEU|nr:uncharacterized protein DUF3558 [Saccharopolyspora dendranthemae]